MAAVSHDSSAQDLQTLVLEAFRRARRSGKPDWYRMAPAVLKNRLLDVTDRRFDQSDYGVQRFGELLPLLTGLLAVDTSVRPAVVELLPDARTLLDEDDTAAQDAERFRVRPDLWDSILDFSSGVVWRWNQQSNRAEPAGVDVVAADERLPTITPDELTDWRRGFIAEHAAEIPEEARLAADEWASFGRRSEMLPRSLRGKWFEYLKRRVVGTLEAWFAQKGLQPPPDLRAGTRPTRAREDHVEELRDFIIRCVRLMSPAELASLQLPAGAAQRTAR